MENTSFPQNQQGTAFSLQSQQPSPAGTAPLSQEPETSQGVLQQPVPQDQMRQPMKDRIGVFGKLLIVFLVVVVLVAAGSFFLGWLRRSPTQNGGQQFQQVTLLDLPFEIPADWFIEKRDGFETSISKVLIVSDKPITVTSVEDGLSYRFNPILVADISGHLGTNFPSLEEYLSIQAAVLQDAQITQMAIEGTPPGVQVSKVTGRGSGTGAYASNQYVATIVIFVPAGRAAPSDRAFIIDVVSDKKDQFDAYLSVAEQSAKTLIQSISKTETP